MGRTAADVRDVMVDGESGICKKAPKWARPRYQPSKRKVTWPNGSFAMTFSSEEPDQLRGPQHHFAWGDEIAAWKYPDDAFSNLILGLRLGDRPQAIYTTTPRPIALVKRLLADPKTVVTRGKTYDNTANLPGTFLDEIRKQYEGTRLGKQEIDGELLEDVLGALWTYDQLSNLRAKGPPVRWRRVLVAVDPAVSSNKNSDLTGIVVVGFGDDGFGYVIEEASAIYSPDGWAKKAVELHDKHGADAIIAEKNQGGEMVEETIRTQRKACRVILVHASKGKFARAEPIAGLYEQGRILHLGVHAKLEDEMCQWSPLESKESPNRIDALVWGFTDLLPYFQGDAPIVAPVAAASPRFSSTRGF